MTNPNKIGQTAILLAMNLLTGEEKANLEKNNYAICTGSVGTMQAEKIIAAIEVAAKREKVINTLYREEHALYHGILEAFYGICRGQLTLDKLMRTVGLSFAVVRERRSIQRDQYTQPEDWIAVALYGVIGAPIKGFEHETIGLGINHL
ncbi:MAG: HutP family protein [Bacillota bacterium]|jgi:hut operon positive regulator